MSLPVAIPIDAIADAALARSRDERDEPERTCDACDDVIDGEPASSGLFLSARGGDVRYEEPSLCAACAFAIGLKIQQDAEIEEEEG